MLFRDRPVEKPSELYDRENEFRELRKAMAFRAITIVVGVRRVGKTSLIKAATHDLPHIYIDARRFEEAKYMNYDMFLDELRKSLSKFASLNTRVLESLKRVKGVKIYGVEIELLHGRDRPSFSLILDALNEWAEEEGRRIVIAIDEAQELMKMKGYSILPSIAYAYDNLRNVAFLFAGSKVGLLHKFLKVNDPSSPLYGRYMEKVELKPLTKEQSLDFLIKGFAEHNVRVNVDFLESVVDKLNGIIGWLSYFGLKAVKEGVRENVLDSVLEEASRIAIQEFCNFVEVMGSTRYIELLKVLSRGSAAWSELKRYLELKLGVKIYDSELARLLKNLIGNGFIEKKEDMYVVVDPVLRYASREIRCR